MREEPLDEELLELKGIHVHGVVVKEDVDPLRVLEPLKPPQLLKLARLGAI